MLNSRLWLTGFIRPCSLLTADCRYFVLAEPKRDQIFRAAHDTLTEIVPSGMPTSLAEAVAHRRHTRGLKTTPLRSAAGGWWSYSPWPGGGGEEKKRLLALSQVDGGMRDLLAGSVGL